MKRLVVLLALGAVIVAACSDDETAATNGSAVTETTAAAIDVSTTAPPAPAPSVTTALEPQIPEILSEVSTGRIEVDGEELFVAIADTPALRQQGLMFVEDLGDLDGMLFIFEQDGSGGFWMKNTLIPLDIAYFDSAGTFVDGFLMEPCTTEDCPSYRPNGSYRYALEMAAGDMPADPAFLNLVEPE
jgi:hypothetical protein